MSSESHPCPVPLDARGPDPSSFLISYSHVQIQIYTNQKVEQLAYHQDMALWQPQSCRLSLFLLLPPHRVSLNRNTWKLQLTGNLQAEQGRPGHRICSVPKAKLGKGLGWCWQQEVPQCQCSGKHQAVPVSHPTYSQY